MKKEDPFDGLGFRVWGSAFRVLGSTFWADAFFQGLPVNPKPYRFKGPFKAPTRHV